MTISKNEIQKMDREDPIREFKEKFHLPKGIIYMDGNSLGALPIATQKVISDTVSNEWGDGLITSWLDANWVNSPERIGNKIASCIGAKDGEVTVCDSTSVNLFKILVAALQINNSREVILSEQGNFPTDLYIMDGIKKLFKNKIETKIVDPKKLLDALDENVSVLLLTQIHYKTGLIKDMEKITKKAHEVGALIVWDLSHSAGSIPLDLNGCNVDFATGCGYKFLNGGPGAPAFLFAVFLWSALNKRVVALNKKNKPRVETMINASEYVIKIQTQQVMMPRWLSTRVKDIWLMQYQLENCSPKKERDLISNPRFRMAYDFLVLRSESIDLELKAKAEYWTALQN
jgi:kynureninase